MIAQRHGGGAVKGAGPIHVGVPHTHFFILKIFLREVSE